MDNVTDKSDIVKFNYDYIYNCTLSLIDSYCSDNGIKSLDLRKYTDLQFNGLLIYIYQHLIKPYDLLKSDKHRLEYDLYKCSCMLELYKYLCITYNHILDTFGYSNLTGITLQTLNNWETGKSQEASHNYFDLIKTLNKYNEYSLQNKLTSKDCNPVGVIAILNHKHNWQQQETVKQRQAETMPLDQIAASIGVNLLSDNGN